MPADFQKLEQTLREVRGVLADAVVARGAGPVAPTFDEHDRDVEYARGKWYEVDWHSWRKAYDLLQGAEAEFPGVSWLLLTSQISSHGNSYVDAAEWDDANRVLQLATDESGWGEEAYQLIKRLDARKFGRAG